MTLRTYSHLAKLGRKPTDYDIGTSALLYYPGRGFEVTTPITRWIHAHQSGSALRCDDWEQFRDPRETTYAKYTKIQSTKETFVDGLLRIADESDHDRRLPRPWLGVVRRAIAPFRYPAHGLGMLAAYFAHMAPSGRIVVAGAFQSADETRRIQRIAYRLRQLQDVDAEIWSASRASWEGDAIWQPLRKIVETALATYDWGESFVATNLVIKPVVDELFTTHLARAGGRMGDDVFAKLGFSLGEDAAWHRAWSKELVRMAISARPENHDVIGAWVDRWWPRAREAAEAFVPVFDDLPEHADVRAEAVLASVLESHRNFLSSMGIAPEVRR